MIGEQFSIQELIDKGLIVAHKDGNYGSNYPKKSEFDDHGVLFLTAKNLDDSGNIDFSSAQRLNEEKAEKLTFGYIQSGDVLLSHNATVGRVAIVPELDEPVLIGTSLTYFRIRDTELNPRYFSGFLSSRDFQNQLKAVMSFSTRNQVPITLQRTLNVNLPALEEQRKIADFVSSLDYKLQLNQKMNQTLEEIAKAIFKSWFVDFDPVRAKAEGRPAGLPPEISDLFPDELVDSEIGEIPKGWVLKPIYDLADFINGAAYKKFEPNKERLGLPIIKIAELKSGVSEQTGFSTVEMGEKYLIRQRDILFSWSGNPDTSIDTFVWQRGDAWLNQHIFKVIPSDNVPRPFLLQLLRSKKPVFTEIARNKQTTGLGHVTVKDLKEMQIALPQLDLFQSALQILEVMHERVFLGEQENLCLADLRDTLLPKLISGELRIPDAEKFLEEAGI